MADKVLIVDDDPAIQKMLEKVMNSNHLEADIASDGRTALEMIRRNSLQAGAASSVITRGCFKYDTTTLRFYKNDQLIDLSSKENSMMLLFMQNPERVFTKDMIYEHVWDNTIIVDNNAIMVYINRLRNKIEDNPQKPVYIQTVRGVGYRFSVS